MYRRSWLIGLALLASCTSLPSVVQMPTPDVAPVPAVASVPRQSKIALVLGGGAARGFAHVGVIKALEAQGVKPDIIVGTSAGALVGALYASGENGFDLQKIAMQMQQGNVSDWSLPNRGVIKGEALQTFVNDAVKHLPMEKLNRTFAAVATDLHSGEMVVFRSGDTGMAVRASSSVPGLFQPVLINGHEYVDGGLTSPIPVRAARMMGADFVIAVDVSSKPQFGKTRSSIDVLLQTFAIMQQSISRTELLEANIIVRPVLSNFGRADFEERNVAILAGEQAVAVVLPQLNEKLRALRERP